MKNTDKHLPANSKAHRFIWRKVSAKLIVQDVDEWIESQRSRPEIPLLNCAQLQWAHGKWLMRPSDFTRHLICAKRSLTTAKSNHISTRKYAGSGAESSHIMWRYWSSDFELNGQIDCGWLEIRRRRKNLNRLPMENMRWQSHWIKQHIEPSSRLSGCRIFDSICCSETRAQPSLRCRSTHHCVRLVTHSCRNNTASNRINVRKSIKYNLRANFYSLKSIILEHCDRSMSDRQSERDWV